VASPALGSAPQLAMKIAFGIALPSIVVAGVINGSLACNYLDSRVWEYIDMVHQTTWKGTAIWCSICAGLWSVGWVLAAAIPDFDLFLGLTGALFGSTFSCELSHSMWWWSSRVTDVAQLLYRRTCGHISTWASVSRTSAIRRSRC
jgi:hypothetical protein